ncbi:unnamed protein product, partial [Discosporangium mesarthrocarpum]
PEAQVAAVQRVERGHGDTCKEGGCLGRGSHRDVRDVLFAPLAWCYKDDGAVVKLVVERIQRCCTDGVAKELVALEASCASAPGTTGPASGDGQAPVVALEGSAMSGPSSSSSGSGWDGSVNGGGGAGAGGGEEVKGKKKAK